MLVPPTPPTKPTPPVAPARTPASSNTSPNLPAASPTESAQKSSTPQSAEVSGIAKDLEGIRKAFQGKSTQVKDGEKVAPAVTTSQSNSIKKAAPAPFGSQEGGSAQTTVPPKPLVMDSKPSSLSYVPFVGIVGVVAVILLGLRLFKTETKQPRTVIDYSKTTTTAMNKEGIDVVVSPQTTAPKVKSNFEIRI